MKNLNIISKVVSRGKAEALPSASASMPNWAELAKYVTFDGDETIHGVKDFANGLMIGGLPITKLQDDVVYLDAHLVVRGGITMFGTGEDVDVPTIMDALSVDGVNLQVINGVLTFVGEATGGVADSVRWENVIGRPTLLSSFTDDVVAGKYLPLSGGTLTGSGNDIFIINRTDGSPYIRFANNGAGLAYFGVNTSKEMVFIPQNSAEILKVLHSGNYSNYALPLTGGTITGTETLPITISNNINDGEFQVGIRLLNPNKTNTNGNTIGTAQFGYTKSDGVYMFNYDNYNYYNCAIGITDDGIAYVGKGGAIDTKYKIWHEGNDGSGSGLSADMLDGYHWYDFYRSFIEGINATNVNTFVNTKHTGTYIINNNGYSGLLLSFNRGQGSVSSIELIAPHYDFHIYGLQARIAINNNRYSALRTFAFTDSNVASATKLQTARTIWGQSFDGTGDVSGTLYTDLIRATDNTWVYGWGTGKVMSFGSTTGCNETSMHGQNVALRSYSSTTQKGELILNSNGDVGIGTASPSSASRLHIKNSTGVSILLESSAVECGIRFVTANSSINGRGWIGFSNSYGLSLYNYNSASYGFCMYDNGNVALCRDKGNVGIGTDSPSSKLDVKGGVRAQSFYGQNGNTATTSSYGWGIYQWNNELQITRRDSSNTYLSTMLGFDLESGNVDITVPATTFGEFTLSTLKSKSHFCLHYNNVFGVYMMVDYNSGAFAIQSGYQNQAKALDISLQPRGGKVGIGTIAPSCSLHVVGDILSTGGITMYSDQRKKTILNHVELSLKQIADAPLIEHYYNSDESKTTHVGSIAQYWASLNDWFCKKDNEGFYTMEIQNAALASAISIARELVKYESKTDKKIRLLKKRIGELEEEIEKLKTA